MFFHYLSFFFFFFHRSIDLRKLIFTSNSITESTGFTFFSNNIPRVRFCSVILENKNVADVFQRFPLNANANLNSNFSFLFFYCIFLIIYFFFRVFIDCHYFNLLLKRFTSWLDFFHFQFSKGGKASRPINI